MHTVFGYNGGDLLCNQEFVSTAASNATRHNKVGFIDLDGYRIRISHCEADPPNFAIAQQRALALFGHRPINHTQVV